MMVSVTGSGDSLDPGGGNEPYDAVGGGGPYDSGDEEEVKTSV